MELKEIVDKLIGDTSAHGCSSRDKELGIEIKCNYFKSQHKNREFIEELFKIAEEKLKQK